MAESTIASAQPDNNGCRMHEEYNFTCGTCNGLFDRDGNPTPKQPDRWDDIDHLLGICNCLPPHDWLVWNAITQKQAIQEFIVAEKLKLLENIRVAAYRHADFELKAHAPGVIVDPNAVKWAVLEKEIARLRKEVE